MNAWIFQSIPDRYDLRQPRNLSEGKRATWVASRYRDRMAPGDLVFFWLAGDRDSRGIYGWGRLTSAAYGDKDEGFGVDVVCERRLQQPLLVSSIESTTNLSHMLILRAPQATNFLLTADETAALIRLLPQSDRPEF